MKCKCGIKLFKRDIVEDIVKTITITTFEPGLVGYPSPKYYATDTEQTVLGGHIYRCPKCFCTTKDKFESDIERNIDWSRY